jgi:hypothetical protein
MRALLCDGARLALCRRRASTPRLIAYCPPPTPKLSFSFFNLELSSIHVQCGGLSDVDIWMCQMLLPLLYPALCLLQVAFDLILGKIVSCSPLGSPALRLIMHMGWRPKHISWEGMKNAYLPPALFFFNMCAP